MKARAMDVAVVGGGPAGAVTAMLLARAGHTGVIVDRSTGNRQSMGEMLPPVVSLSSVIYR
jgi:2-polyprenyl-6-methoxyphenol hydroxylase-like FAD-dependent oxidoreductase